MRVDLARESLLQAFYIASDLSTIWLEFSLWSHQEAKLRSGRSFLKCGRVLSHQCMTIKRGKRDSRSSQSGICIMMTSWLRGFLLRGTRFSSMMCWSLWNQIALTSFWCKCQFIKWSSTRLRSNLIVKLPEILHARESFWSHQNLWCKDQMSLLICSIQ